jgi:hypothetical protein
MNIDIEFADGCVGATARDVRQTRSTPTAPASKPATKPKKPTGGDPGQGSLFG